jgi:hypothetical protein
MVTRNIGPVAAECARHLKQSRGTLSIAPKSTEFVHTEL